MSVPTTQKAGVLTGAKKPYSIVDRPVPKVSVDDVLIKITATAINPVDWKVADGYFPSTWPVVGGSDGAGEIVAVGSNVKDRKVGDRVFFQGYLGQDDKASFQQYAIIPSAITGLLTDKTSDDEGAGISLATVAGLTMLYAEEGLHFQPAPWEAGGDKTGADKVLVVLGGSSSVGLYTIQLARLSGFEVITNSSKSHFDRLKRLGATHVLDRTTAKAEDYAKVLAGRPLAGIADSISSGETQQLAIQIFQAAGAASGGKQPKDSNGVAVVLPKNEDAVAAGSKGEYKTIIHHVMGIGHAEHLFPISAGFHNAAGGPNGWIAKGLFEPNVPEVLPGGLRALDHALDKNRQGVSGVKVVIHPHEA